MPATDAEPAPMEDPHAAEDEKGSLTNVPSPTPPAPPVAAPTPPFPTTVTNFAGETVMENRAVSMASNDCSPALSSPAEASPAKPAVTSPSAFESTVDSSPATSHMASASDSLKCTGTTLVDISESLPPLPALPPTTFGKPDQETDFASSLTFNGVTLTLENNGVWRQFHRYGTEMILTKQGRRMFPYCRYRLAGLDPERKYSLVLSIVPSDQHRYRWGAHKWEVTGPAEHHAQGLIRAFSHHYSPCKGSDWMGGLVSFYKVKLTNNSQDREGHIILHSMHRYIPRLHVIPVPDGAAPTQGRPVVMGPESMTFTFPQTEFMAVTTYQNYQITQLKINHNPFAKGFREDGHNSRLNRVITDTPPAAKTDSQSPASKQRESPEKAVDLSTKNHTPPPAPAPRSNARETRLVLKPIMSTFASKNDVYVPCIRGKHALGELVLVQIRPRADTVSASQKSLQGFKATSTTPASSPSTPTSTLAFTPPSTRTSTPASAPALTSVSSPGSGKRRKRINRRWANSRGREWKSPAAAAASPAVVHSPSLTGALQPELDDVEGLLFVSFTSKEALDVHVRSKSTSSSGSVSPVSPKTPKQPKETEGLVPVSDEEKIARSEAVLLQDLRVLKHRQVIHPVLQEVGLKLSSLDHTKSIDLQYLGVRLPLPPVTPLEQGKAAALSLGDKGLPFISRTGKTSDMTKIKGWRNKFIKSKETPPNSDGLQKNLSAFCSNMLDEYLESEAQQISERAAAFSTSPEGSVAYQLPAKSSSYVKTLDSVLKHRNAASRFSAGANRPCPLSHKPLLYSALTSPAPPLASPAAPGQAGTRPAQPSHPQPGASAARGSSDTSDVLHRSSTCNPGVSQRPAVSSGQSPGTAHRPSGTHKQNKLLQMEVKAMNQGLSRTRLTPERVSLALSTILTKQMLSNNVMKVARHTKHKDAEPGCGQEFCRLGCVCSSLQQPHRGPVHCRRPECMFGCTCFKRKITKQFSGGECKQQIQPVYSMTNVEHAVQPRPGSHTNKLWKSDAHEVDSEPLFVPKSSKCSAVPKAIRRCSAPRPQQPIREEDKGPVYKYLESLMTCARVRGFNSKPPPEDASTAQLIAELQKPSKGNLPRTVKTLKKAVEKTCQEPTALETEARKQIQIQSACQWDKDRKMVLEALCQRMNLNRLSQRFSVGPYRIRPVAKIFMRKPSGSTVTYRVHISKPSQASDNEEEEFDDSDEEKLSNTSFDEDKDGEEEESEEMQVGVTPFLGGVLPAGRLRARTKPVGCQAHGLIQVNGKSYNQARLLLGNMGSLHPANRLAAYVAGRLRAPADTDRTNSQKRVPTQRPNPPIALHIKAAGTVVPPIITARKTTDLKTAVQPPAPLQPESRRKASVTLLQNSQHSSTINSIQSFVSSQRGLISSFPSSSVSSPVSLTVSPSLKTPSFLGQRGTYSFRICPPANQNTKGQNLPGVSLPGGFTLIQLPKHGAAGAAQQSDRANTTNVADVDKALPQRDALLNFGHSDGDSDANWLGLDIDKEPASSGPVEPGSLPELMCEEKMPSEESDENNSRRVKSNPDLASEGVNSDSSDYCGDGDEDDEMVDIETVEDVQEGLEKMKDAVYKALLKSRDFIEECGSEKEHSIQDQMNSKDGSKDKKRKNHSVLERQRRYEQRSLFDKLQTILQSDPRAPRLRLLTLALKEIKNLVETSKYLEEKKKKLIQMQSVYLEELSALSGKSAELIKYKLKDICRKQKIKEKTMKWKPFFSHLLQSKAALLQLTSPQPKAQSRPLLQPDFCVAPPQPKPETTEVQSSVRQVTPLLQLNLQSVQSTVHPPTPSPTPQSLPPAVSSPTQAEVTADPVQVENQSGESVASVQVSQHQSDSEDQQDTPASAAEGTVPDSQSQVSSVPTTPQVTASQDGASPVSSTLKIQNPSSCQTQSFSLPLVRSKTGRIILPSSLKSAGYGFYTLKVMKAKQKAEEGQDSTSADMQPTDEDSNSKEKSCSGSDRLSDSESRPNSDPKSPPIKDRLSEIPFFNKSISKTQQERQRRGRPRKNRDSSVPSVSENGNSSVVQETRKRVHQSETSPVSEQQSSKIQITRNTSRMVTRAADIPVPAKRRRGRPPKSAQGGSAPKSNMDSPVALPRRFKSPSPLSGKGNTSRPLTRGSLGKDFPSAKKRSWIDVEKELEPDIESE